MTVQKKRELVERAPALRIIRAETRLAVYCVLRIATKLNFELESTHIKIKIRIDIELYIQITDACSIFFSIGGLVDGSKNRKFVNRASTLRVISAETRLTVYCVLRIAMGSARCDV